MNKISNGRKRIGSYVWHGENIHMITLIKGDGKLVLDRKFSVKPKDVRLVKQFDLATYRPDSGLPERCISGLKLTIRYVSDNGIIGTYQDLHDHDGTDYNHLVKYRK